MLEILRLIAIGFSIAAVTGLILGVRKAVNLPGGSLGCGFALWWQYGFGWAIVGALLGFAGWFAYCCLVGWLHDRGQLHY